MSTETAPIDRADLWCNCQSETTNGGPWHPLGDTSSCPPPETPADFCRWLLTLDDPEDVQGRRDRQSVNLTQKAADVALYESGKAALDQAAADMAHRDDLARDVAGMWGPSVSVVDAVNGTIRKDWPGFAAALDRLAAAYGEEQ